MTWPLLLQFSSAGWWVRDTRENWRRRDGNKQVAARGFGNWVLGGSQRQETRVDQRLLQRWETLAVCFSAVGDASEAKGHFSIPFCADRLLTCVPPPLNLGQEALLKKPETQQLESLQDSVCAFPEWKQIRIIDTLWTIGTLLAPVFPDSLKKGASSHLDIRISHQGSSAQKWKEQGISMNLSRFYNPFEPQFLYLQLVTKNVPWDRLGN